MLNSPARWIRQEYKTNKDKFEKPFKITVEHHVPDSTVQTIELCLEQNYKGLGCTVWDGSIALAKMFENDLEFVQRLQRFSVLELGAGCGLVGLTLFTLGAKYVVLTDMEVCLPTLKQNVDKNISTSTSNRICVKPFVWGQDTSWLTKAQGKFDVVVAAEVLYDELDSKLLAQSSAQLLAENGVMFVSMGRNCKGEESFVEVMKENGFNTDEVPKENLHPKYHDEIIKVIKVTKQSARKPV